MEIRNRSTGDVTTVSQFKASYPNTSFPKQITPNILDSYGYDPVLNGPAAVVVAPYEISVRDGVVEVDGQWFTHYVVGPTFVDTEELSAIEAEAAYRARIDEVAATGIRSERDKKLVSCDWTVLPDNPLEAEDRAAWTTYRQSLRDITTADGFPHSLEWPVEPS